MNKDVDPIDFEEPGQAAPIKTIGGIDLFVLIRLAAAAVIFVVGLFFGNGSLIKTVLMLLCFLLCGYDMVLQVITSAVQEHRADERILVLLASLAAFAVSLDYEGAAVILLFRLCRTALEYVSKRSRSNALEVVDSCPDTATILTDDGEKVVSAFDVRPGDTVILRPGDYASVDCIVVDGYTSIDCSSVTGADHLINVEEGDTIPAGAANVTSMVQGEAIAGALDSTVSRICDAVCGQDNAVTPLEEAAIKYSGYLVPGAVALSAVYALLSALVGRMEVADAVHRGIVLLMLLSPFAVLNGYALTFFTGICGAAHRGIVFRGGGVMSALSRAKAVLFDMHGTVTTGEYTVDKIVSEHFDSAILLKAAAHAAANATSPAARAIVSAFGGAIDYSIISNLTEYPDGFSVTLEGLPVLMGNRSFMEENGVAVEGEEPEESLALHVALGGRFAGTLLLADTISVNAAETVDVLSELGCEDVVMLSEENRTKTRSIARTVGINKFYYQCLPMDKLSRIHELSERAPGDTVAYVCGADADPAALESADVGMMLGAIDRTAPVESANLFALDDDIRSAATALRSARATERIAKQGLLAAVGIKGLLILLTIFGVIDQAWFAAVIDGCAGIACALNAVRAFAPQK